MSSPKVAFSVFDVYICILSCLWRDELKDQSSSDSESHLELYFPLLVHSVILTGSVVVILGTETFIVVTGIVSPWLSCGTVVRTCEDVPKRRMLLWVFEGCCAYVATFVRDNSDIGTSTRILSLSPTRIGGAAVIKGRCQ